MNTRPGNQGSDEAEEQFGEKLYELIQHDGATPEDILDAATTRAMCLYATGSPDKALQRVPEPVHKVPPPTSATGQEGWKATCVVIHSLVRGQLALRAPLAER